MHISLQFLIFFTSCVFIFKTTDWFVRGTVDLAAVFRLPKVFVGVTLVSLVTTAPEFIVSVSSSFMGEPGLAVGNALGSCICNIGLVFAVGIMLKGIKVYKVDYKYKFSFLVGVLLLEMVLINNGILSRKEAVLLFAILAVFLFLNYRLAMHERSGMEELIHPDKKKDLIRKGAFFFLIGGLGTVLLARFGMVTTGKAIAEFFGVPPIIIGLTLVAFGTSLPEFFTAIVSAVKGHGEIALGNVVGANLLNLLFVLGSSAMAHPLTIDKQTIYFNMPALIIITLVMFFLGYKDLNYDRKEGIILLSCYLAYLILLFTYLY